MARLSPAAPASIRSDLAVLRSVRRFPALLFTRSTLATVGASIAGLFAAALPVMWMARQVFTTGANVATNDTLIYLPMITSILSGRYAWQNYFADTFLVGAHAIPIPMLMRLAVIWLTHWNVYAELWIGFALTIVKLVFMFLALTCRDKSRGRWLLLPVISALVFAPSQLDSFAYGDTALELALNQLALAVGVWALVRYPASLRGAVIVAVAATVAPLSGGGGLPVVPVLFFGLLISGSRNWRHYAVWAVGALLGTSPYIFYRLIHPARWTGVVTLLPYPHNKVVSFGDVWYLIGAIGYPFRQYHSLALMAAAGLAGFTFGLVCLVWLWSNRSSHWVHRAIAGVLFSSYGLINIILTMSFRGFFQSWYATHFMPLWIGLAGLAYLMWSRSRGRALMRAVVVALCGLVALQLTASAAGSSDKLQFLTVRTPASASCVRNYATAPLYCEKYVFNWGVGHPGFLRMLGQALARYHLSVFAPQQEWALQGDFVLDTVHLQKSGLAHAMWVQGTRPVPSTWYDYHHLNLLLAAPNAVTWTFRLPANTVHAKFASAIALGTPSVRPSPVTAGVTIRVKSGTGWRTAEIRRLAPKEGQLLPINLSLTRFAGHSITLRLSAVSTGSSSHPWTAFQYPVVNVAVNTRRVDPVPAGHRFLAAPTTRDQSVDVRPASWQPAGVSLSTGKSQHLEVRALRKNPFLTYRRRLDVCLSNYSYLYVRASGSPRLWPRGVEVYYQLQHQRSFYYAHSAAFPFLADSRMHAYSFDLKLLELPPHSRLVGLRIAPLALKAYRSNTFVSLSQVRLIKSGNRQTSSSPTC